MKSGDIITCEGVTYEVIGETSRVFPGALYATSDGRVTRDPEPIDGRYFIVRAVNGVIKR
jgi:hypothetical protein